ncbi:helix-turn-helix transcriptional regulator [Streptomyces sp. NPDC007205]|uniref:helix-turn-helix transcriptional regulator n=1 Tax=Streptomyces sp. NPDC007205 TaxID=3154316 RepID=UPI00340A7645
MDLSQIVPLMGDEELTAYRFLVATGGATIERLSRSLGWGPGQTERVLSRLGRVRLARSGAEGRSDWTAVHPDTIRLQYAKPLSGVIDAWQEQLDGFREQLDALSGLCVDSTGSGGLSPVVTVEGASDIRDLLQDHAARCAEEVFAVHPLGRGAPALAPDVLCRDSRPPDSSVDVRVLLPHLSRYDADVRDRVERIEQSGGEVRTGAATLPSLVVFDRSVAFLLDGEHTGRAHVVKHAALVDFIVHLVVSAWATSAAFQPTGGNNRIPESLTQETKTAIVQLLAAGYKDEVVARRLGIGVRTCRKYIAEMFGDLGAQSRFQAGWMARDHMLVDGLPRAGADRSGSGGPAGNPSSGSGGTRQPSWAPCPADG